MTKNSNTIAQEQKESCNNISQNDSQADEAANNNLEGAKSDFAFTGKVAYYCDLTGFIVYI